MERHGFEPFQRSILPRHGDALHGNEAAMTMPSHIWRVRTPAAMKALARRFGFPLEDWMQDWEYQVADFERIDEFIAAYGGGELSEDEKFVLMETIIESFEDLARRGSDLTGDARWGRILVVLDQNIALHAYTVWYWSCLDAETSDEPFFVSALIRQVFDTHAGYFVERGKCQ